MSINFPKEKINFESKKSAMIVFPNAKINIGLNIVEKRADGFHNIQTVFYPIGLRDVLEVLPNQESDAETHFTSSGIQIPGDSNSNLCIKAYDLIKKDYDLPAVKIYLQKIIPIGAGLGGGSADGAFFIRAINDLFEIGLSWGEMHHYARQLGSDCSFFVNNKVAYAQGKGDELDPINLSLKGMHLALINPGIHIETKEAYAGVRLNGNIKSLKEIILIEPIENWNKLVKNDFEESIFPNYPEIKDIKEKLYEMGAIYSSMSGSGSSVYGIFKNKINLNNAFQSQFIWQGELD